MNTVFLVTRDDTCWDCGARSSVRFAGVFTTRELAEEFVRTRRTPRTFSVHPLEVFDNLDGCNNFTD